MAPDLLLATTFSSDTGFGNYFNWALPVRNLAAVEDLVKNPENHYLNLHTFTDPGGAARAQAGTRISTVAVVAAAIAANLDKNATSVAPGGLLSIFGVNLVKVATDLSGWATSAASRPALPALPRKMSAKRDEMTTRNP